MVLVIQNTNLSIAWIKKILVENKENLYRYGSNFFNHFHYKVNKLLLFTLKNQMDYFEHEFILVL